jgi:hypothetical protein
VERYGRTDGGEPTRLLLPVGGLVLNQQWDVGHVRFHPAGTAAGLIEASQAANLPDAPDWARSRISTTAAELDSCSVADLIVSGDIGDAMPIVDSALTVLRAVQHMECPMADTRHQSFGLPGQVTSALVSYFTLTGGALPGWRRTGVLAGWTFSDDSYTRWISDPAYRFLDEALKQPEESRTALQRRALVATQLLSNSWLSLQPDVCLLNAVMALEVLLGEDTSTKKHLIARRVSYFTCGWPGPVYADGTRTACALMSTPLRPNGAPGGELAQLLSEMRAGNTRPCSQYFNVLALYDARSTIVHEGKLGPSADEENSATWFIAARLLHRVLTWFARHPDADLTELDTQIAALRPASTNLVPTDHVAWPRSRAVPVALDRR